MRNLKAIVDTIASLVVATAAVALVGLYLDQRIHGADDPTTLESQSVAAWREANTLGIQRGSTDAPIVVTEFMDFTCPFCAQWAPVMDSIVSLYGDKVATVFHHFPLGRTLSRPSAIAAECAERQSRFHQFYRIVFAQQASLGTRSWVEFADEAGVPDLTAYQECVSFPIDSFPRIGAGLYVGTQSGVQATPTVWVNGSRFSERNVQAFQRFADQLEVYP